MAEKKQQIVIVGGRVKVVNEADIWDARVADNEMGSIVLPPGSHVFKEPQWIINPKDNTAYPIRVITVPDEFDADGNIVSFEHETVEQVEGAGECPNCGPDATFHGFILEAEPPAANCVLQCQRCRQVHFCDAYAQ